MKTEPAVIVSTVGAFLTAIIGLGIAFGLNITDDQRNAILGTLAPTVALIFLLGPIIRQFVFSPHTTETLVDKAEQAGATNTPAPPVVP